MIIPTGSLNRGNSGLNSGGKVVNIRWTKSVSLALVLVALLITSGVGPAVLAQPGGDATGPTVSQSTVLDPGNQPSAPPGQPAPPDLVIQKTALVSADGQTLTYTLTVKNVGGIPVMGLSVNDVLSPLPPGAQFVSASGTGNGTGTWTCTGAPGPGPVNCAYSTILAPSGIFPPNDQPLTITIVVAVGPSGGDFGNCAMVSHQSNAAVPPDSNLGNNTACVKTSVKPPPPPTSTTTYIYSVKIVCGTVTPLRPGSIPTLQDTAPVVPGLYRTAINIHNFWEKDTAFLQKVAIALPQDRERGPVTRKIEQKLGPNQAVEVDCYNIVAILQGTPSAKAEFLKGFLVIESPVELEVTAVYTADDLQLNGIAMDVEQVWPHVAGQGGVPLAASAYYGCPPYCGLIFDRWGER